MQKNPTSANDDSGMGIAISKKFNNMIADEFEGISHISKDSTSFFKLPQRLGMILLTYHL